MTPSAGALGIAVPCLYLEESIESPARSGLGPARSDMGFRQPRSVQMVSKFGGMKPLQCPRAFTMALTGGVMEPSPAHTFDAFRLEPPPGGLWRGEEGRQREGTQIRCASVALACA